MTDELFWVIVNNQNKWRQEYNKRRGMRHEVRKVINRKFKGKGGDEIKKNIMKDLQRDFLKNEITIIEDGDLEFSVIFDNEHYSVPRFSEATFGFKSN